MTTSNSDWKTYLAKLDSTLDLYLVQKAPALPTGAKEAIVKYGPWITLILLVLSLPLILGVFGLATVLAPVSMLAGARLGVGYIGSIVLSIGVMILEALAIAPLMKRSIKGWNLLYYSILLGAVGHIISLNIASLIISTGLSLYIIYQVKSYYK